MQRDAALLTVKWIALDVHTIQHEVVGHLVVWCQVHDCDLPEVSDEDLAKISPHLTPDVRDVLTIEGSVASRNGIGGTAPDQVAHQFAALADRVRHLVAALPGVAD